MTPHEQTLDYIAGVLDDVAAAGGTHVDDDHASGPGELSPEACRLAARFVRLVAARPGERVAEHYGERCGHMNIETQCGSVASFGVRFAGEDETMATYACAYHLADVVGDEAATVWPIAMDPYAGGGEER
jgi:hypothetical protein